MNAERVEQTYADYSRYIIPKSRLRFKGSLYNASEDCLGELAALKPKKRWLTLIHSVFCGAIGADRFYLGDLALGITKAAMLVASVLFSFIPVLGTLISYALAIACTVWYIADIFLCYRRAGQLNSDKLLIFLNSHAAPTADAAPLDEELLDGIYVCPNCKRKMVMSFTSASYRCPDCGLLFTGEDVAQSQTKQ